MNEELKTMHLFAGAGGGILADLILGHRPIVAVEWDKYACDVLRARVDDGWFEGMSVWEGDVRLFDPSEYKGRVDCIHAGFPCQDISQAGSQRGVGEDTRSGLYRQVLRIADEVQPKYLFLENVAAIVSGDNGRMLRTVVGDLANRGYDCVWRCLSASEVGANHVRGRWWLLAYPKSDNESECSVNGQEIGMVADTNRTSKQRRSISIGIHQERANSSESNWWKAEPAVDRVADGVASRSHRLKALGNGQVPLQCATAFKLLWEEHNAIKTASRKGGADVKGIDS